jgi:hypothetical protein
MLNQNNSELEFEPIDTFTKLNNQTSRTVSPETADQLKPAFAFVFLKNTIRNL